MRGRRGPALMRGRGRLAILLLLVPAGAVFALLFVWPQAALFRSSIAQPPPLGLAGYVRFFGDSFYLEMLARSLALGVCTAALTLAVGFPLAYLLARMESRWAPLLLMIVSFPLWVSAVVRSFGWMVLFLRNGLVSEAVRATGLVADDFQVMFTFAGVVIALAQVLLPLMVITLYAVIRGIDHDLELAAMNLGAAPGLAVMLVTLRLARGGIVAGSLLVFSLSVSAFATPSLVGGARAQLMAVAIYEQTLELLDWPFAATLAAVLLVISIAVALAYGRLIDDRPAEERGAAARPGGRRA